MNSAPMTSERVALDTSEDAVLGGRLLLRQPLRGHRVGHDAILLAAASAARAGELAVDLGAGVGAAGLALAARVAGLDVALVEIDPALCELAARNARRNGLADRVRAISLDVMEAGAFAAVGLNPASADLVLMNPPFNDPLRQNVSSEPGRRLAYAAPAQTLPRWVDAAARLLRPDGVLTLMWRADGLAAVLETLATGFGGIGLLPVHPRPDAPAIRVLARAVRASRAPLTLHPALILNDADGCPSAAAEAVLRGGATLSLAND
jgi:tRNA1(Val) A37 N6-methylase TrmN6